MAAQTDRTQIGDELRRAAARLSAKRLAKPGDVLSQRIPEQDAFASVIIGGGPENAGEVFWAALSSSPTGLHHRIYAARPDVGAILSGQLPWTGTVGRMGQSMPAIFDEQVRHLGVEAKRIDIHSAQNVPIPVLANGANAYCLSDAALCFGMGLERLMLNVEILEKSAQSFALAKATGGRVRRIPWLIKFIANKRLRKDRDDAAAHHLRGERSIMKAGY